MIDDLAAPHNAGTIDITKVIRTAHNVEKYYIGAVPFDMKRLCEKLGIEVLPLSYYLANGASREGFYALIGNEDGAAVRFDGECKILYNDEKPRRRIRFTLAEELMHILLRHVEDERFDISRRIDTELYERYEREAKSGAGLLLMSPVLYYRYRGWYSLDQLAVVFDMSVEAVYLAAKFCNENEEAIKSVYGRFAPASDRIAWVSSRKLPRKAINIGG